MACLPNCMTTLWATLLRLQPENVWRRIFTELWLAEICQVCWNSPRSQTPALLGKWTHRMARDQLPFTRQPRKALSRFWMFCYSRNRIWPSETQKDRLHCRYVYRHPTTKCNGNAVDFSSISMWHGIFRFFHKTAWHESSNFYLVVSFGCHWTPMFICHVEVLSHIVIARQCSRSVFWGTKCPCSFCTPVYSTPFSVQDSTHANIYVMTKGTALLRMELKPTVMHCLIVFCYKVDGHNHAWLVPWQRLVNTGHMLQGSTCSYLRGEPFLVTRYMQYSALYSTHRNLLIVVIII